MKCSAQRRLSQAKGWRREGTSAENLTEVPTLNGQPGGSLAFLRKRKKEETREKENRENTVLREGRETCFKKECSRKGAESEHGSKLGEK